MVLRRIHHITYVVLCRDKSQKNTSTWVHFHEVWLPGSTQRCQTSEHRLDAELGAEGAWRWGQVGRAPTQDAVSGSLSTSHSVIK